MTSGGLLRLVAVDGDDIVALIRSDPAEVVREALCSLTGSFDTALPGVRAVWGVSAPHTNAAELGDAFEEATTAVQALRQDSQRTVALYEDLGVLGLLIGGPRGVPLTDFASAILGALLAHDAQHGTRLLDTLRAYLDNNCSQRDTAVVLFVHQKTVKYRLAVIERLTGLQLHEHRDRMRADIAVRAVDLN
jgi:DNA-binding PucR family transcriptional regulator